MNTEAALIVHKGSQALSKPEKDQIWAEAGALIKARMFPDKFKTAEEAFMVALYGREIGLTTQRAWKQIHLIKGQPGLEVHLQVAKVREAIPGLRWRIVEHTMDKCVIEHGRTKDELNITEYTLDEGKASFLPWATGAAKNRRDMLYARAAGRAVRWFYPETQGSGLLHNVEELRDALETPEPTVADKLSEAKSGPGRMPKKGEETTADRDKVIEAEVEDQNAAGKDPEEEPQPTPSPVPEKDADAVDEEAVLGLVATISRVNNLNDLDRAHTEWRSFKHNPATLITGYEAKESRHRELTNSK